MNRHTRLFRLATLGQKVRRKRRSLAAPMDVMRRARARLSARRTEKRRRAAARRRDQAAA